MTGPCLVIGIGNAYRSDDRAGLAALQELRAMLPPEVACIESNGDGAALLDLWTPTSKIILIDAALSDAPPGTIHRFDAINQPLPTDFSFASTHHIGIAETIHLARMLDRLPESLTIYAIEGKNFMAGQELSPEVEQAVQDVVEFLAGQFNEQRDAIIVR